MAKEKRKVISRDEEKTRPGVFSMSDKILITIIKPTWVPPRPDSGGEVLIGGKHRAPPWAPVSVLMVSAFFWKCPTCDGEMERHSSPAQETETIDSIASDPWCDACLDYVGDMRKAIKDLA